MFCNPILLKCFLQSKMSYYIFIFVKLVELSFTKLQTTICSKTIDFLANLILYENFSFLKIWNYLQRILDWILELIYKFNKFANTFFHKTELLDNISYTNILLTIIKLVTKVNFISKMRLEHSKTYIKDDICLHLMCFLVCNELYMANKNEIT